MNDNDDSFPWSLPELFTASQMAVFKAHRQSQSLHQIVNSLTVGWEPSEHWRGLLTPKTLDQKTRSHGQHSRIFCAARPRALTAAMAS